MAHPAGAPEGGGDGPDGRFGTTDDDRFETLAEVDAVPWVGDAALARLVDFARAGGWVPADEAIYGVVEGLTLTEAQAAAALRVANGASFEVLDRDVGLDARAARGIVDLRPHGTVEDVAAVPWVGPTALQRLIAWGEANPATILDAEGALFALETAAAGLWFTSESDYPLDAWLVPAGAGPLTLDDAAAVLAEAWVPRAGEPTLAEREVEEVDLDWFFARYTEPRDWWEPAQHEDATRWQALREVFDTQLTEARVFRFGVRRGDELSGAIDVFVVGRTADGWFAGVRTVSVET